MKVAIVHDWLVNYGGAEDVVAAILELYPEADIFTLVYDKKRWAATFQKIKSTHRIFKKFHLQHAFIQSC